MDIFMVKSMIKLFYPYNGSLIACLTDLTMHCKRTSTIVQTINLSVIPRPVLRDGYTVFPDFLARISRGSKEQKLNIYISCRHGIFNEFFRVILNSMSSFYELINLLFFISTLPSG